MSASSVVARLPEREPRVGIVMMSAVGDAVHVLPLLTALKAHRPVVARGNDQVGEGRMTIEKSEKPSLVEIKLEFLKPFESTTQTIFTFSPAGAGSKVSWAMTGDPAQSASTRDGFVPPTVWPCM